MIKMVSSLCLHSNGVNGSLGSWEPLFIALSNPCKCEQRANTTPQRTGRNISHEHSNGLALINAGYSLINQWMHAAAT